MKDIEQVIDGIFAWVPAKQGEPRRGVQVCGLHIKGRPYDCIDLWPDNPHAWCNVCLKKMANKYIKYKLIAEIIKQRQG